MLDRSDAAPPEDPTAVSEGALRLVSLVAVERVKNAMRAAQGECVRFAVVGFDRATVPLLTALAGAGLDARVWASEVWDVPAGGAVQTTDEPPGYFRDLTPPKGVRAIIFAPSIDEVRNNQATLRTVARVAPDVLKQDIDAWIRVADPHESLTPVERTYFRMVLQGLVGTEILTRIEVLGAFVDALSNNWTARPPHQAVAEALPAIRIPRGAGKFKAPGARGAPRAAKSWASELQDLHNRATDLAFLRNDRAQPLDRSEIRKRCEQLEAEGEITPSDAEVIKNLLDDHDIIPGEWRPSQAAIVGLEWNVLQRVFRTPKAKSRASIAEDTERFFELYEPNTLDEEDRALLALVDESRPATPEEKNFFERIRTLLRQDPPILKRWERFVYARAREHEDLLVGIVASTLELLPDLQPDTVLLLRAPGAERLSFWEDHARELGLLLRDRYRGLEEALGPRVKVDFGHCWSTDWESKTPAGQRVSRDAYQMKFELHALSPGDIGADGRVTPEILAERARRQFVWTPAPHSLQLAFTPNFNALRRRGGGAELLAGRYARTVKGARMRPLPVKLTDTRSFLDTEDSDAGVLFNPNDAPFNVGRRLRDAVAQLEKDGAITREGKAALEGSLTAFEEAYSAAVDAFAAEGIGAQHLISQGEKYGELLDALRHHAHNDAAREVLWRPVALIGLALPRNGDPGAIVTPFAPFRLAEVGLKARALGEILTGILREPNRPGADDFLTQAQEDLATPWFSDVAIVPLPGGELQLMAEQVTEGDFGLFEPVEPKTSGDQHDAFSREAAQKLLEACLEYLELHPYDAANFSLALYNGQSREMPGQMAELLGKRIEEDSDLRCDLFITHDDRHELRRIYTEQNLVIGREVDSAAADGGRSFLSRLRVGFLDSTALATAGVGRPGLDIAFLQDVIGRHAQLAWRPAQAPAGGWPGLGTGLRGNRSRRLAPDPGQRATRVLLCSPSRPRAFQSYLNFARAFFEDPAVGAVEQDFEPLKAVSYDHPDVRPVIAKAHESADWVVTFDPVADRQLFIHNGISIISFAPSRSSRNNLIISTRTHSQALKARLQAVLCDIQGRPLDQTATLASQLIAQAADLSGRIVLRAANNHRNALELMGVVLAHRLAAEALEPAHLAAWLFVDDLKTSLGHAPGDELADLVAIALHEADGKAEVELLAIEAKFVEGESRDAAAQKSASQLQSTLERLESRFGAGADDLNRTVHLARLADLMVEHGKRPRLADGYVLRDWAARIRRGDVSVRVRGLSTVFVHDGDLEAQAPQALGEAAQQIVFDRAAISQMLGKLEGGQALGMAVHLPTDGSGGEGLAPPSAEGGSPAATTTPTATPAPTPAGSAEDATASEPSAPEIEPVVAGPVESPAETLAGFSPSVSRLVGAQAPAQAEVEGERWLATTIKALQGALRSYGMTSEVVGSRLTPNAALVRLRGSEQMTVALVEKRRETLLTSHGLDVVAVRPGSREVVIMIARPERMILPTLGLWKRRQLPASAPVANTSFIIGEREDNGEILYLNLGGDFAGQPRHGPHTLIAGETGGGKGVLTQNLLLDICATNHPSRARVQLVDPKAGLDYGWIEGLPHLDGGIVTTRDEAIRSLEGLVDEMERRNREVLSPGVPNIDRYNAQAPADAQLPRIYFFHDELGDWMADKQDADYRDAVENYVVRLAQKSRAAGIHLFLITQRPDREALPGQIKANMGNKICLRVSNRMNSQIVLDETGAETLLGSGHLIAKLANQRGSGLSGLIYAQSPFISEDDAADAAAAILADSA